MATNNNNVTVKDSKILSHVLVGLVCAGLGGLGVYFFTNSKNKDKDVKIAEQAKDIEWLAKDTTRLSNDANAYKAAVDMMRVQMDTLNKQISQLECNCAQKDTVAPAPAPVVQRKKSNGQKKTPVVKPEEKKQEDIVIVPDDKEQNKEEKKNSCSVVRWFSSHDRGTL